LMGSLLQAAQLNVTLWTNGSKVAAIGGTMLGSYLGLRLWVFVLSSYEKQEHCAHSGTWRHPGEKRS
jgi:hypothetical protein